MIDIAEKVVYEYSFDDARTLNAMEKWGFVFEAMTHKDFPQETTKEIIESFNNHYIFHSNPEDKTTDIVLPKTYDANDANIITFIPLGTHGLQVRFTKGLKVRFTERHMELTTVREIVYEIKWSCDELIEMSV